MTKISEPYNGAPYVAGVIPSARVIATVRNFVVVGNLFSPSDPWAVRWSALGDPTDWPTPATDDARAKQAGSQTLPSKHGWVTGIAGNDFFMYVFQERGITKATYVGGDIVFAFDTFEEDRGCESPGQLIQIDDKVFFKSDRGFHVLEADQITDIGFGSVNVHGS